MFVLVLIIHLLVCFSLILVVLLQSGKGGGLAGAFGGGGGSQALFGGRGAATFLSKATTFLGAGFMLTSLGLALLSGAHRGNISKQPDSLMKKSQQEAPLPLSPSGELPGAPSQNAPQGTGNGPQRDADDRSEHRHRSGAERSVGFHAEPGRHPESGPRHVAESGP